MAIQKFTEAALADLALTDAVIADNSIDIEKLSNVNLNIAPEVLEIQVSAPQAGQDTQWLWTWLTSSLPYARRTITNSPEISVPLYKQGTYTVNNYAAYETFDQMTQTHSLYLKWIDGAGTDNLVSWATSTGPVSDSHPDINDGNATDVQRINISVPSTITLPTLTAPSVSYTVTNNGSGAYTFSGSASGDNPNIGPFYRGGTYTIDITATGHPFYFTTDNGTNFSAGTYFGEYTSGVTGSRTDSGTITFTVPSNAPDTLYYQCGNHSAMRGAITVKDLAVETNINGNYIVYFQHTQEGHKTPVELRPIPSLVNQMCLVYDAATGQFVPQDLATYVENTPSFENKIREVAGTAELVVEDGSAVIAKVNVYDDSTYLPLVGNNPGDQAFATDTDILYIWDGSAWQQAGAANTDDLAEGSTNLFYTDARVASYLSNNDFDTATNIVASITDSAPATLDTLNELAAALGDDPNFATTTANNIATKLPLAGGTMTGDINLNNNNITSAATITAGTFSGGNITKNSTITISNTSQTTRTLRLGTFSSDSASYFGPNNDADSHDLIDLGVGDGRWRNLNISGQANIGSLNATGLIQGVSGAGSTGGIKLHTNSGINVSGNYMSFHTGQTNGFSFNGNSDGADNSNQLVVINSSGNLGIGATNPATLLHLQLPTATNGDMIRLTRAAGAYNFQLGVSGSSSFYLSDNENDVLLDVAYTGVTTHKSDNDNILKLVKTTGSTWNYIEYYSNASDQNARSAYVGTDNSANLHLYAENSRHVVMGGDGNTGIGTWTPERKLHVKSNTIGEIAAFEGTNNGIVIQGHSSDANIVEIVGYKQSDSTYADVHIRANADGLIVKEGTGNVGINALDPQGALHIRRTGTATLVLEGDTNNSGDTGERDAEIIMLNDGGAGNDPFGGTTYGAHGYRISTQNYPGKTSLGFDEWHSQDGWLSRLQIDGDGKVGIGMTVPEVKLEVNGGADGSVVFAGRSDGGNGNNRRFNLIAYADGGGANYGGGLKIQTRDSVNVFHDRITVQSNGYVGIGTTGPSYNLEVNGSFGATSITETSSIAYKENVRPISDGLSIIEQLVGVIYDRKDGSKNNEAGLIAEDVDQILPNLVSKVDGEPEGIQYTKLTAYLIEAVKTLSAEVKSLKEQLK